MKPGSNFSPDSDVHFKIPNALCRRPAAYCSRRARKSWGGSVYSLSGPRVKNRCALTKIK